MSPIVVGTVTIVLLILLFLASVVCFSLRTHSQARLDEICERAGLADRFLEILRHAERALVGFEILLVVLIATATIFTVVGFDLVPAVAPVGAAAWFALAIDWFVAIAVGICFAIVFPRALARAQGEQVLFRYWNTVQVISGVFEPIIRVTQWVDKLVHRLFGLDDPNPNDPEALAEEIRSVVDAGARLGALNANASSMIDQVMDMKDADVGSVMTPRTEMCCVRSSMGFSEALRVVLDAGHTRLPLIGKSNDDIVGILYAKDLLRHVERPDSTPALTEICREPFYVPETTSIDKLLETMNRKRVHLAIVLDEYGGVAGLVTMEDVLEEIVGEIVDEYDDEEVEMIRRVSETAIEVDARLHIDDLVEKFEYPLPEERDYDTIGGFVFAHLGRIPVSQEEFEWQQLRIKVLEADHRRVYKIRIESPTVVNPQA